MFIRFKIPIWKLSCVMVHSSSILEHHIFSYGGFSNMLSYSWCCHTITSCCVASGILLVSGYFNSKNCSSLITTTSHSILHSQIWSWINSLMNFATDIMAMELIHSSSILEHHILSHGGISVMLSYSWHCHTIASCYVASGIVLVSRSLNNKSCSTLIATSSHVILHSQIWSCINSLMIFATDLVTME